MYNNYDTWRKWGNIWIIVSSKIKKSVVNYITNKIQMKQKRV